MPPERSSWTVYLYQYRVSIYWHTKHSPCSHLPKPTLRPSIVVSIPRSWFQVITSHSLQYLKSWTNYIIDAWAFLPRASPWLKPRKLIPHQGCYHQTTKFVITVVTATFRAHSHRIVKKEEGSLIQSRKLFLVTTADQLWTIHIQQDTKASRIWVSTSNNVT